MCGVCVVIAIFIYVFDAYQYIKDIAATTRLSSAPIERTENASPKLLRAYELASARKLDSFNSNDISLKIESDYELVSTDRARSSSSESYGRDDDDTVDTMEPGIPVFILDKACLIT